MQIGIKYFFMAENLEYQESDFWAVSKIDKGNWEKLEIFYANCL